MVKGVAAGKGKQEVVRYLRKTDPRRAEEIKDNEHVFLARKEVHGRRGEDSPCEFRKVRRTHFVRLREKKTDTV